MTKLIWGAFGDRHFETGIDRGVLYLPGRDGLAWSGLTAVQESPTGGDAQPYYLDGVKYLNLSSAEEFEATIEAFSAPFGFQECDGTSEIHRGLFVGEQPRKSFSFSYRTLVGNDLEGTDFGYKLHIVYNALAEPTDRTYATLNDSPSPSTLSWRVTTLPSFIPGRRPTAHLVIDSRRVDPATLAVLEGYLYGSEGIAPRLPSAARVIAWMMEMDQSGWVKPWNTLERPLEFKGIAPATFEQLRNKVLNPRGRKTSGTVAVRENLHNPALINNLAFASSTGDGQSVGIVGNSSNYRGYSLPVTPGEVITVTRPYNTSRFRWVFTVDPPVAGGPNFGGTGMASTYDNLNSATITVPTGANYLLLYFSNTGEDTTKTLIERGTESKPYFDGDTWSGDSDFTPTWTGTPRASTSQLVASRPVGWSAPGGFLYYSKRHDALALWTTLGGTANAAYAHLTQLVTPTGDSGVTALVEAWSETGAYGRAYILNSGMTTGEIHAIPPGETVVIRNYGDNSASLGAYVLMNMRSSDARPNDVVYFRAAILFEDYSGPYFDGHTEESFVHEGQQVLPYWDGAEDASDSVVEFSTSLPESSKHGDMVLIDNNLWAQQDGVWGRLGAMPPYPA